MTAPYTKVTTGLAKLAVARKPAYQLGVLYRKTLQTLERMPADCAYRKYTQDIVRNRFDIVIAAKTVEEIEEKINMGQAEELIVQAENELLLSRKFLSWKPWEPLISEPPEHQWSWPPSK